MRQVFSQARRLRLPGLFGLVLFVAGLLRYRSFANRDVLGRWSVAYTGVIAVACALLALLALRCWLRARRREAPASRAAELLDLALLAWGAAYLLAALDSRDAAARLLDGNLFGSVLPAAALLEWVAMSLALCAGLLWCARAAPRAGPLLLGVGTFLVLFALAEGALRIRAAVAPQTQGFPTYTDRAWGRRHVTLNTEGFRDVEHARAAPAGTRRLLLVGDSYGFGTGVERLEDRFGEQLAAALTGATGEPWESVSAARPDSDTLDEIGFLEHMLAYHPDLVVLLYVFNDVDYLVPVTRRSGLVSHPSGVLDRLRPDRLLFTNSYTFQELFVRARLAWFALAEPEAADPYEDERILSRHVEDLGRFVALARGEGAAVAIAPFELTVLLGEQHLARYRAFLERLRSAGLPSVDLAGAFDGHDYGDLTVNRLDRHPNPLANRLAARATARWLLESRERYLPSAN